MANINLSATYTRYDEIIKANSVQDVTFIIICHLTDKIKPTRGENIQSLNIVLVINSLSLSSNINHGVDKFILNNNHPIFGHNYPRSNSLSSNKFLGTKRNSLFKTPNTSIRQYVNNIISSLLLLRWSKLSLQ